MKIAMNLSKILKTRFFGAEKIAVLAIGSELRADDASGMLVGQELGSKLRRSKKLSRHVKIFLGNTAPENLTGEIKSYKPSHLVLIDSCELGKKPGTIGLIDPDMAAGISFSTHQLPLKILVDYMKRSLNCKAFILGVQPKVLKYGHKPSKEVLKTSKELAAVLFKSIQSVL
ncbi:MAG: hydrogenase 3 maturation endopeptidase HyCI [Elusimicrobia bacterium]|nr:hydrogenase 3 maturation endopeptidase HyCI [Candidatus Liberimonas magnetica]